MMTGKLFSPRTIGVCGSSKGLPPEAAEFCRALGRRLAEDSLARIVSGGTKKRQGTPEGDFAADWLIVDAARAVMDPNVVFERIVTVIRDDGSGTTGFRVGAERRARGKTGEARRINFVRDVDALIAVGGRGGTSQELALAIEQDVRVLPAPTFAGSAREFWDAYRPDLVKALRIDEERAHRWENAVLTEPGKVQELAIEMVDALFNSLPRRCFVIMPFHQDFDALFDFVIAPAVKAAGDEPVRVDRVGAPGDIKKQIDDGIKNCEYAIAVLDDLRANVLYELGIAHGQAKTTILMNRQGTLGNNGSVPFDLFTQHRLEYEKLDAGLTDRLKQLIKSLSTTRR
jgi:predicted Rossmann-fold nucleotide-binding protein